jgi:hypothetical protein
MLMSGFCSILHHFLAEQSVRKEIKPLQAKAIALYSADPSIAILETVKEMIPE